MTRVLTAAVLLVMVFVVASWTYTINYAARDAAVRVAELEAAVAAEREAIKVLKVEWTWLNRPERLEALVARHSVELGLMPLDPAHYGRVSMIAFPDTGLNPAPPAPPLSPERPTLPMTLDEVSALKGERR